LVTVFAVVASVLVTLPGPSLADTEIGDAALPKPVVAVFDFDIRGMKLAKENARIAADRLRTRLTATRAFSVVPDDLVVQALMDMQKESHQDCHDDRCRIELGKSVSANKYVAPLVMKVGRKCQIQATLYDVQKASSDTASVVEEVDCTFEGVLGALDLVAADLAGQKRPEMPSDRGRPGDSAGYGRPGLSDGAMEPEEPAASRFAVAIAPAPRPKVLTRMTPVSVVASSELPSKPGYNAARNVIDGKAETWWGEGAPGDGLGEWIEVRWNGATEVREVRLISGYQKLLRDRFGDRWYLNNRIRRARIDIGGKSFVANLDDRKGFQSISIPTGTYGDSVRVVILDVYPGYNSSGSHIEDSGISEIQIMALQ
jgi:hypothetical protein